MFIYAFCDFQTQEQLLQELVYPGTNISTIPITILTTILYTSSSNNKTLNARLLARVITGCHYT